MKHFPLLSLLSAALVSTASGGTWSHHFNSLATDTPNGGANANITLTGGLLNGAASNATILSSKRDTGNAINLAIVKTNAGGTTETALRLADKNTASGTAAMWLPVIDAGVGLSEFTLELDLLMNKQNAGATPADGFSISLGQNLSGLGGSGGHATAYGLVINFDTYQNSATDPRSIEIFSDGAPVFNFLASSLPGGNFTFDTTFRHIILHWDANGLDLTYGGIVICNNLPMPGFSPVAGSNFAFNSTTGGLFQDTFMDNLSITTVPLAPEPPIVTSSVVIEEIMADNADGKEDEDLDKPDWLELFNGTAEPVSLNGWRLKYVSNPVPPPGTTPPPASWTLPNISLPAGGYQLIFASGKDRFTNVFPHTNFQIMKEGGTLTLCQADGTTVVDMLTFGGQKEDIAYGRLAAAQTAGFLETPTPGAKNTGRQAANFRPGNLSFFKPGSVPPENQPSAAIAAPVQLGMALPADAPPGAEIRYTTDNSEPHEGSALYTAPITISTGTSVKARVFTSGYLPSRMGNRGFIWLSSAAADNVATNYNGSGAAFSSSVPVLVLDSYLKNVDALTNPAGLRPYRFTQAAIYDVNPSTGRVSFASPPTQVLRSGTHVRGQSSSGQAERPYAWEFWKEDEDIDRDEPLLGMPAHSDWVLMSLTLDKSLMRNWLMQQLMLDANGPGAGMRCRFVEVFFNQGNTVLDYADYRGVYLLIERISRTRERGNLAKLNDAMSDPALINGGYILKNDKTPYDSPFNPVSNGAIPGSSRTYDIFDPEPPTVAQVAAIKGWFDQMTPALASASYNDPAHANYYGNWLDERTFIDRTLWLELCKEVDAYTFSYYSSKDRNGPLKAIPLWDVDRSLGNSNYGNSNAAFGPKWWHVGSNYTYYTRLDDDAEFRDRYWNRWWALRRSLFDKAGLFARIEGAYSLLTDGSATAVTNTAAPALQVPAARHYRKYPNLGAQTFGAGQTGQVSRTTWRQEVDVLKAWIADRLDGIDQVSGLVPSGTTATLAQNALPPDLVNHSTGVPQFGGNVPSGYQFRISNPNSTGGTVYYSVNGNDPRQSGGALNPGALTSAATTVTAATIAASGATWKWLLPAAAPVATWINDGFDDSAWGSGAAPLGYGEASGLTTNISPTAPNYTNATTEPGVAYFRSTFNVTGAASLTGAMFEMQVDDGAIVYLNGQEVARVNFPYAPATGAFTQEANGPLDPGNNVNNNEALYWPVKFDHTRLREGSNTLAVEVHQAVYSFPGGATFPGNTLSDLRCDVRVVGFTHSAPGPTLALASPGTHVVRTRVLNGVTWSPLTEATFVVDATPASAANLVVSEFHYHPADPSPAEITAGFNAENDFEFIELLNISPTAALDLTGVKLEDAISFDFSTAPAAARYLPPGGRVVVVENVAGFLSRLGSLQFPPVIAGTYTGNLSNGGETIILRAADGGAIKQFTYNDKHPWPEAADGLDYTLVLTSPLANPDHNTASNWHASAEYGGYPGNEDHGPAPAQWDADSDGDGLTDGVEYALGAGGANPSPPVVTFETYTPPAGSPDTWLYVRFQRNLEAGGLTIQPELSVDLSVWDDTDLTHVSSVHNHDGTSTETWRTTFPASALPGRLFLHVLMSRLP